MNCSHMRSCRAIFNVRFYSRFTFFDMLLSCWAAELLSCWVFTAFLTHVWHIKSMRSTDSCQFLVRWIIYVLRLLTKLTERLTEWLIQRMVVKSFLCWLLCCRQNKMRQVVGNNAGEQQKETIKMCNKIYNFNHFLSNFYDFMPFSFCCSHMGLVAGNCYMWHAVPNTSLLVALRIWTHYLLVAITSSGFLALILANKIKIKIKI